jgi:hypothetical protein
MGARIEQAQPEPDIAAAGASAVAMTTASPQIATYKGQIRDQLAHVTPILGHTRPDRE